MVSFSEVVLVCCAFFVVASSVNVEQCPGQSIENLSEHVQLSPCKHTPCRLRKNTNQFITVHFTPDKDVPDVRNHVTAEVLTIPVPFVGVDGMSICDKIFTEDGEKAACPLKAGTKYTYKDSFPVLGFYPTIATTVHWALKKDDKDLICFEIPVKIV